MCGICEIDVEKADAFSASLMETINQGAISLMLSIGHQMGLFDCMYGMPPGSSEEVALRAGLHERYVREWLNAMVCAKIVQFNEGEKLYHLPMEHAVWLSRKNPSDNIAVFAQYIPVMANAEQMVMACFKNGGGVPYASYDRFHDVMAEDSGQTVLGALEEFILPLVPGLTDRLSEGIKVLDVGCGRGRAMLKLAGNFPNSQFTGIDLCPGPIEEARSEALHKGLSNIHFLEEDLTHYMPKGKYEWITAFDAIHDQAKPDQVLGSIYQALTDDGVFLMQDICASENVAKNRDHPFGRLLYSISTMHCTPVSLSQGGMGLGTMWGTEKAIQMLSEAGFSRISKHTLPHDSINCYFVVQK